jgi:excisionase family DNA binding protein
MTTKEAAAELGVSERRVRALIASGKLAARKMGRDWWITEAALEKLKVRERPPGRPRRK